MRPTTREEAYPRSFVELVRDNSLAIAQPAIERGPVSWPITRRIPGSVIHRHACDLSVFGWQCLSQKPVSAGALVTTI